jgi:hypothetical protein
MTSRSGFGNNTMQGYAGQIRTDRKNADRDADARIFAKYGWTARVVRMIGPQADFRARPPKDASQPPAVFART